MNKTTLFSLLGLAVIIIAGAIIVTNNPKSASNNPGLDSQTQTSATGTMSAGKKAPFSEFVKQGGSYQCSVNQYLDAGMQQSTQGTVYVDNGKIRGEYSVAVQGNTINTTVIVRDGFAYTWTSMASIGYKVPVAQTVGGDATVGASGQYSWNDQMIGDYNCQAWVADSSKFTVPATITFQEIKN